MARDQGAKHPCLRSAVESQVVPIIVWSVFGRRDPPGEARYERLFAARKSGTLKKVKYTGLTPMDPAGVRSKA